MSAQPELTCTRVRVLLEPFVDGDLDRTDPASAARMRVHLATCPDCRRQHQQAVSLPFRIRALTSPAPAPSLVDEVMRAVAPARRSYRRAWLLLAPEALLAAFIVWYVSGLDGLASLASGMVADLQRLVGWGVGAGAGGTSLPVLPGVDVVLLIALIALAAVAVYHITVLVRIESEIQSSTHPLSGRRRA